MKKMKIQVDLISKELIKPSSPTPPHLRHLRLSFLDQIQLPVSMPFVFFYSNKSTINNSQKLNLLKQSLPQVLSIFYPLAGRVKDNSHIDCNDEGLLFVEAKANCEISDILRDKNANNNNKFIPLQPDEAGDLAAFSQITFFNCGGLAVSFALSHKLGDALSKFIFLNAWAAFAKGKISTADIQIPPFGSSTLFPPQNLSGVEPQKWICKEKLVTKVFVFDSSTISALRDKYSVHGERLSRVEALAIFIWSRFVAVIHGPGLDKNFLTKKGNNKRFMMVHAVNLRPRMEPPLQKQAFGNLCRIAVAEADKEANEDECYGIVKRMKNAIRNVNVEYVKSLQKGNAHLNFLKESSQRIAQGEIVNVSFSSLCNFPAYETDFGWGKPEWVASARMVFKNLVIFLDTKDGLGIEAWVSLKEEDMALFEIDAHLLSHGSFSTSNGNTLLAHSRL